MSTTTKPSLLRGLFSGEIADELLFPYPAPLDERRPEEAKTVRRLVEALNAMVATGLIDSRRFDEEETIGEPVIRAFAEAGLLALTIPREYGGLGLSASAYARVFGAVASIDASLAVLIGVHCGLGGKAVVLFGNDAQKARYLPGLARGETLAAYALTEPETGSDAQHIVTQARRAPDDTRLAAERPQALDRQRPSRGRDRDLRTNAGACATARRSCDPRRSSSAPTCRASASTARSRKLGIRGSTQAELVFDDLYRPRRSRARRGRQRVSRGGERAQRRSIVARLRMRVGVQAIAGRVHALRRSAHAVWRAAGVVRDHAAQDGHHGRRDLRRRCDGRRLGRRTRRDDVDASLEAACAKVFAE